VSPAERARFEGASGVSNRVPLVAKVPFVEVPDSAERPSSLPSANTPRPSTQDGTIIVSKECVKDCMQLLMDDQEDRQLSPTESDEDTEVDPLPSKPQDFTIVPGSVFDVGAIAETQVQIGQNVVGQASGTEAQDAVGDAEVETHVQKSVSTDHVDDDEPKDGAEDDCGDESEPDSLPSRWGLKSPGDSDADDVEEDDDPEEYEGSSVMELLWPGAYRLGVWLPEDARRLELDIRLGRYPEEWVPMRKRGRFN